MQPSKPLSLISIDSFEITGRGRVYTVEAPYTYERATGGLLGQIIQIDGALVKVVGVESFALMTIRKGTRIGLFVQPAVPYNPRRHFADLLHAEMGRNPDIVVLAGDLGYRMWDPIVRDFPDRFHNVGAAEQLLLGVGVGLALEGKIPVCYSITPFLLFRAAEWIRNYLDHEKVPVKLVGSGLGEDYEGDGFSHFVYDVPRYMGYFPNVATFYPEKHESAMAEAFRGFMEAGPALITLRR